MIMINSKQWRYRVLRLGILLTSLALAGCTHTYRYKLTVTVRTSHGSYASSSVVEVSIDEGDRALHQSLCGDATAVDLGNGRVLFALTTAPIHRLPHSHAYFDWRGSPTYLFITSLGFRLGTDALARDAIASLSDAKGQVILEPDSFPELVTFSDLKDPRSIREVDPMHPQATLGADVKSVAATVILTKESITSGHLKKYLPWLDPDHEYIDGRKFGLSSGYYRSSYFQSCKKLFGLFNVPARQI